MQIVRHYLDRFEALERAGSTPRWLRLARRTAIGRFAELGFPSSRDEDWRATNAAPLAELAFEPAAPAILPLTELERLLPAALRALGGARYVFVNGCFAPALSAAPRLDGLEVTSLAEALPRELEALRSLADPREREASKPLRSLNLAFFSDGAFVHVQDGAKLPSPIHLVFVTVGDGAAAMAVPRVLVQAGQGSSATLVESYLGGGERTLTNGMSEIHLEAGASLDHYRLQDEAVRAFHVGATCVEQAAASRYHAFTFAEGGALARHELDVLLAGEGASCTLDGLTLVAGGQLIDQHTFIDHARPHTTSDELYKGIVDGEGRGVFHGRILVRPGAQKTDARQANRNLLLTPRAQVNTKPQLEIHADDVKCSHGAAVGQLDREALFYLRSRGLGEAQARALLTEAFAGEVTQRMGLAPAREAVEAALRARLRGGQEAARS